MSQAIVDPTALRRFAQTLKHFNAELQHNLAGVHGQLTALGDTWRDQEHLRFVQEFEETVQVLERFMAAGDEHVRFLMRKAQIVEDYLQQR
jgi:uncharacterized protein YukE